MYNKSVVRIIIGKVETSIEFKVAVKQGGSMAQALFLFLILDFAETLEDEWTALGLSKPNLHARITHQDQPDN